MDILTHSQILGDLRKYNTSTPTNNPNNGTTWSNNASVSSGSFGSGEEATKGFDGNTGTKAKTTANGASITISIFRYKC